MTFLCAAIAVCWLITFRSPVGAEELPQPSWGKLTQDVALPGALTAEVAAFPEGDRLPLPTPFPHLVRVRRVTPEGFHADDFEFNSDASQLHLVMRPLDGEAPGTFTLETADRSQTFADGRIVFTAADAVVQGETAKLERHPGNDRIGFWTNADDYVAWEFDATRWGMYRVWLTYSTASPDGSEIQIDCGGARAAGDLRSTGSWYRYTTIDLGPVYLREAGKQTLTVRCVKKIGGAVMNLKAVILDPACEGTPPAQADDGVVTLHGRDATVHGITLRYEPAEKKQTLGYWVRPEDRAEWTFTVTTPGTFDVEALQGCGTGQGGSPMVVRIGEQVLRFEVEETGHFQNFRPRSIGRVELPTPGDYTLSIQPERIANKAACDIRQLRLIPVR